MKNSGHPRRISIWIILTIAVGLAAFSALAVQRIEPERLGERVELQANQVLVRLQHRSTTVGVEGAGTGDPELLEILSGLPVQRVERLYADVTDAEFLKKVPSRRIDSAKRSAGLWDTFVLTLESDANPGAVIAELRQRAKVDRAELEPAEHVLGDVRRSRTLPAYRPGQVTVTLSEEGQDCLEGEVSACPELARLLERFHALRIDRVFPELANPEGLPLDKKRRIDSMNRRRRDSKMSRVYAVQFPLLIDLETVARELESLSSVDNVDLGTFVFLG